VKLLKLSIVPAVLLFSVVMAGPASAHEATGLAVTQAACTNGQICINVEVTIPATGNETRQVKFELFGVKGQTVTDLNEGVIISLPASTGSEQDLHIKNKCFAAVTGTFDHFLIKYEGTVSGDLTLKDSEGHVIQPGDTVVDKITPCVTQTSPSPSPAQTSPSPSPSAATTTALAGTGGFDFRFPLIGLTVLLAGLALLLVSASRGRSTTK